MVDPPDPFQEDWDQVDPRPSPAGPDGYLHIFKAARGVLMATACDWDNNHPLFNSLGEGPLDIMATKSLVRFITKGQPWHEELMVGVSEDSEPRHVLPLLVDAFKLAKKHKIPLHRATRVASALAACSPRTIQFLSVVVDVPQTDSDLATRQALALCGVVPHRCEHPLPPSIDYFYQVDCHQDGEAAIWRVEIYRVTEAYVKSQELKDMELVYPFRELGELAAHVSRVANYAELGGKTEEVF